MLSPRCLQVQPTTPVRQPSRTKPYLREHFDSGSPTEQRPDFKNDLDVIFRTDGEWIFLVGGRCFSRLLRLSLGFDTSLVQPRQLLPSINDIFYKAFASPPVLSSTTNRTLNSNVSIFKLELCSWDGGFVYGEDSRLLGLSSILRPSSALSLWLRLRRHCGDVLGSQSTLRTTPASLYLGKNFQPGSSTEQPPNFKQELDFDIQLVGGLSTTRSARAHSVPLTCLYVFQHETVSAALNCAGSCSIINVHLQEGFPFVLPPSAWDLISRVLPLTCCRHAAHTPFPCHRLGADLPAMISGPPSPRPMTHDFRPEETRWEEDARDAPVAQ
ncbi:hypothetical protein NLJ89_g11656 [Agrocybe chaxingu]|uniref:Uncharacterized protein n=1 Tax=Agrocybe chaxingu TaxID=84603 RepID=A0A9W8JNS8_9AGAR|nr:hypothetical protein NLJ89_g11656 [Agrocybe chaxingu]